MGDDDEWVRVIGRAVGGFTGSLELDAVVSESRLVTALHLNRSTHVIMSCPSRLAMLPGAGGGACVCADKGL